MLGSGISQDQNIHDSIICEELQKVRVVLKDATLSKVCSVEAEAHIAGHTTDTCLPVLPFRVSTNVITSTIPEHNYAYS